MKKCFITFGSVLRKEMYQIVLKAVNGNVNTFFILTVKLTINSDVTLNTRTASFRVFFCVWLSSFNDQCLWLSEKDFGD